jgi:hypothetical protein
MAVIKQIRRGASAFAATKCVLFYLDKDDFVRILNSGNVIEVEMLKAQSEKYIASYTAPTNTTSTEEEFIENMRQYVSKQMNIGGLSFKAEPAPEMVVEDSEKPPDWLHHSPEAKQLNRTMELVKKPLADKIPSSIAGIHKSFRFSNSAAFKPHSMGLFDNSSTSWSLQDNELPSGSVTTLNEGQAMTFYSSPRKPMEDYRKSKTSPRATMRR